MGDKNYNSGIHHRHSIRLPHYDYSQNGLYFITVCVKNKECLFGNVENGNMILNENGNIVNDCWFQIPQHFPNTKLHEYVIMPNHIHGILEIHSNDVINVGTNNYSPLQSANKIRNGTTRTIGSMVRGFKIGVTKQIGFSIWQRNYWEHVIRNENEYLETAEYILNNPLNWEIDKLHNVGANNYSPLQNKIFNNILTQIL